MTLEKLAEETGLSVSMLNGIELGRGDFSGKTLLQIANALSAEPGALLDRDPTKDDAEVWSTWRELRRQGLEEKAQLILRALLAEI